MPGNSGLLPNAAVAGWIGIANEASLNRANHDMFFLVL